MAFQAKVLHLRAIQHARISRAVRFVATPTTLQTHRRVLKCERPSFVRVAVQTSRLIVSRTRRPPQPRAAQGAVGVVAVDTLDRALSQGVRMGPQKLRRHVPMTSRTLLVRRFRLRIRMVHRMATGAAHLPRAMRSMQPTRVGRLILVTSQAGSIHFPRRSLGMVQNELGLSRLAVLLSRSVTRFAGLPLPSPPHILFDRTMSCFQKRLAHVFVADEARLRPHVARGGAVLLSRGRGRKTGNQREC